jgi:hypothetical protein
MRFLILLISIVLFFTGHIPAQKSWIFLLDLIPLIGVLAAVFFLYWQNTHR